MTSYLQCDYCGLPIDPDDEHHVRIDAHGMEDDGRSGIGWNVVNELLGHYHATSERPCYEEMWQRMVLVHQAVPSLAQIPTATPQKIARLRRNHKKAD